MVCRTLPAGELDDDTVALTFAWVWVVFMVGSMVCLSSCRSPDAIRVGAGYRDEVFGTAQYDGQMAWVEGEWVLRPTVVEFSPDSKLFLSQQEATHNSHSGSPDVTVNLPGDSTPEPADGRTGEIEAIGGWDWYVWVGLPFALIALAVPLWVWTRRKASHQHSRITE